MFKFFKKIFDWFKAFPPFWKKLLSYITVFVFGAIVAISICLSIIIRGNNNTKDTVNTINTALSDATKENREFKRINKELEFKLSESDRIKSGFEESNNRYKQLVIEFRANAEKNGRDYSQLKSDNKKLRERESELIRINSGLELANNNYEEIVSGLKESSGQAGGINKEIIEILQGILANNGDQSK